jgi:hypothetical protein
VNRDREVRELLSRRAEALDTTQPDQLARVHARIRTARRRRAAAVLAAGVLTTITAAAVTAVEWSPGTTTGSDRRAVPAAGETEPRRWTLRADGASADTVLVRLEAPSDYEGTTWFVGSDEVTVGYWLVSEVPEDPCREKGRRDPGPTVEDLVRALDRQRVTTITDQEPVTVGGHDGTYLELRAPDVDYTACQEGQLWLWETPTNGARHANWTPEQLERVWIIDVDGQRVVLNAFLEPQGDPGDALAELQTLIDTVQFVEP